MRVARLIEGLDPRAAWPGKAPSVPLRYAWLEANEAVKNCRPKVDSGAMKRAVACVPNGWIRDLVMAVNDNTMDELYEFHIELDGKDDG